MPNVKTWQTRIKRAERLAGEYPFAAEILSFYIHLARFQETVQDGLLRNAGSAFNSSEVPNMVVSTFPDVVAAFSKFLKVVEQHGPEPTGQAAREILTVSPEKQSELLDSIWRGSCDQPSSPEAFLAFAFLQPYAEFSRGEARLQLANYTHSLCPFCNRKPALGVLRPLGDGAARKLLCGLCLAEWDFRRIACPGCGEEDHTKLPVYTAETFPHIRVECCDSCHAYIKCVDLTKNGLAEPLVDELASIPLNLWAEERGYRKLHPNLLGM